MKPDPVPAGLYWLPALGVGVRPNLRFAEALRARGFVVEVHEWRGLGTSPLRASRRCDWGYRELLDHDIPQGLAEARARHPDRRWWIGGHSLGGQLGLLHAAHAPDSIAGSLLVASGQPHWRAFPLPRAVGILAFMLVVPLIARLVGHYPGDRLGFAGREAARLMRDWARTGRRGDYRLASVPWDADAALRAYRGPVRALHLRGDALVPPGAVERLRHATPLAEWDTIELGREAFSTQRDDHFGWLKEPEPVAAVVQRWMQGVSNARAQG